jgi:hypothetical protein
MKTLQNIYEEKLQKLLKEYSDHEGTTAMDGLISVIAAMQIRIKILEDARKLPVKKEKK